MVNKSAIDYWTAGHAGIGFVLAAMKIKESQAILFAILWEVVEQPFTNESAVNIAVDAIATYAGYKLGKKIFNGH